MLAFNMLWKLCVLVAFGLSATVTATEVAQEQPKKESFVSRFFGKKEKPAPKTKEVPKPLNKETQENTDTEEPPKFSLEWYMLPKQVNRASLRERLPWDLYNAVPEDCDEEMLPVVEKRVRKFLSTSEKSQSLRRAFSVIGGC